MSQWLVIVCLHIGSTIWFLTTDVFSFFLFCHLKNLLLFLTSAIQEVTSACSSLMFTKIFGFNTDLLSVACCALVCSDFSLLDLHHITTMYYFLLVFRWEKLLVVSEFRLASSFQQTNTNLFKRNSQERIKSSHFCMIKLDFAVLFLYLNVECLY